MLNSPENMNKLTLPISTSLHSYDEAGCCRLCGFNGALHVARFLESKSMGLKDFPRVPKCISEQDGNWRERMRLNDVDAVNSSTVVDYVVRQNELDEGLFDTMFSS